MVNCITCSEKSICEVAKTKNCTLCKAITKFFEGQKDNGALDKIKFVPLSIINCPKSTTAKKNRFK